MVTIAGEGLHSVYLCSTFNYDRSTVGEGDNLLGGGSEGGGSCHSCCDLDLSDTSKGRPDSSLAALCDKQGLYPDNTESLVQPWVPDRVGVGQQHTSVGLLTLISPALMPQQSMHCCWLNMLVLQVHALVKVSLSDFVYIKQYKRQFFF